MPTDLRVHHLEMNRRRALGLLASGTLFALSGAPVSAAERLKGEALRKAFVKRFERPRVALAPEAGAVETKVGIVYEKWTIASEAGQRVPLLIARAEGDSGRRPAVVGLHGLGGRKETMFPALDGLVRRGFVAVALDARYHGDRAGDLAAAMIASFKQPEGAALSLGYRLGHLAHTRLSRNSERY